MARKKMLIEYFFKEGLLYIVEVEHISRSFKCFLSFLLKVLKIFSQ